jgi:hypothetical protein
VGVRVRVGPKVGKGRSVAVGPIGRGVAVGPAQAVSSNKTTQASSDVRIEVSNFHKNAQKLYLSWLIQRAVLAIQ